MSSLLEGRGVETFILNPKQSPFALISLPCGCGPWARGTVQTGLRTQSLPTVVSNSMPSSGALAGGIAGFG